MIQPSPSEGTHALVIGGSIAGLLAARVLSRHFQHVTIIERDHYPTNPAFRPGVPQSRHIHILLLRGQHVVEALFPGIKEKLLKNGAIRRDYGNAIYYYGGRCPALPQLPQLQGWSCSRELLEWQLRQELALCERICFLEGQEVTDLLFEHQAVCGVRSRARNDQADQELRGDLIVDASGRFSKTPQWLKEGGYVAPKETLVPTGIGYATRLYEATPHPFVATQTTTPPRQTGVVMSVEKGMVVGLAGDDPPEDDEAFRHFIEHLPDPAIREAIRDVSPISKIYGYRHTENRWCHFESLRHWPEGFIVVGDAVCTFNPLYGQGMTVAALQIQLLDACLHASWTRGRGFTRRFQRKVAQALALPWIMATATEARRTHWLVQRYLDTLITLLPTNPNVWRIFLEVVHMVRSPRALLDPSIVFTVFARRRR
ncbi:hypothetical protein KSF_109430 [Reticulibacter mediterranei]|uniref:FAD-binding domain-containing protein n=1 Tax=Reticulibacter mediterranei TaxID=2778369 RepID=A0A8J3IYM5_9CHLR|nr:FAD-dependent monooxygenase [Reticulibacter mediterranei]GHP00896.1 hypothetical protein KSF_109430 [Reticulibacter mediterranei]